MTIKQLGVLAATMLLVGLTGSAAAASPASSDKTAKNMLPVYVEVDKQGKITTMDPAYDIQPKYEDVLRKTLQGMITKPARDKDGEPMSSQFIITMDMQTAERKDGNYQLKFSYVSIKKVPPGNWHWAHLEHGRKLALASNSGSISVNRPNNVNNAGFLHRASQAAASGASGKR